MDKSIDIVVKGNVITMANQQPRAEAIGIKGEKIVSVSSLKEIEASVDKATKFIDLTGKTILPGFIDTHTHALATGRSRLGVDLSSVSSISETLTRIKDRCKKTPPRKWVFCWEYNRLMVKEKRFPDIAELDSVSMKHPISIQHYDTHFFMLNSLALKQLGISPDAEGVVIDSERNPTGLIKDPASTDVWYHIIGLSDNDKRLEQLSAMAQKAITTGTTSIHAKENLQDICLILKHKDILPIRIKTLPFFYPLTPESIDEVIEAGISCDSVCVATYADGSIEGRTAALYEPYTDDPGTLGMLYYTDDEMYRFVEKAHQAGFQISIHAESDRSIDQVLRAYEKVLDKYPRKDHRHRIEHFEIATRKQIRQVARLGVTLGMQPMFIPVCEGPDLDYYRSLLGDERVKRGHVFRSILDEEILVSGGSDSPVTKMNPLGGIHACVNHPLKEQRIDVYEAIEMFTINGAKIGFEEESKGSIEPGKLADFVVLSHDPYLVPRENIGDIKVEMTIIGGNIVYRRLV